MSGREVKRLPRPVLLLRASGIEYQDDQWPGRSKAHDSRGVLSILHRRQFNLVPLCGTAAPSQTIFEERLCASKHTNGKMLTHGQHIADG